MKLAVGAAGSGGGRRILGGAKRIRTDGCCENWKSDPLGVATMSTQVPGSGGKPRSTSHVGTAPTSDLGGDVYVTVAKPLALVRAVRPGRRVPKSVGNPWTVMS